MKLKMQYTIRLTEELSKRLNDKSIEIGIKPDKIVNDILNNELDTYSPNKYKKT